jgi:BirA family transcriptional regulator, biotin operon repressor / biotin---[acetyl-CoA-carboxylase] ligase
MSAPSPFLSNNILVLSEIDSTNSYALQALQAGTLGHGSVVQALHQTAGRGQRANTWQSEAGKDLLLSIVVQPQQYGLTNMIILNMAVCVSLHELLRTKCPNVGIKWSNDIYVGNNKISGVLIENSWRGDIWNYAVIGIGININSLAHDKKGLKATGILAQANKAWNITDVRDELLHTLHKNLAQCKTEQNAIMHEYNKYLKDKDATVVFEIGGKRTLATVKNVAVDGKIALMIDGVLHEFTSSEAKWIV